jgi:epoxyqueuosine reductase QueG
VDAADLKRRLIDRARALGFDGVRITEADLSPAIGAGLDIYIEAGHHGDMGWLASEPDRRRHPQGLWPEAVSAIILGTNYGPSSDPLAALAEPSQGAISVYASGDDYHDIIKKRLKALGRWLHEETGAPLKVFVDTAPVMEKPLAQAAGLGWQGKHTNLVSREFGSWLFLGEIFTSFALPPDPARNVLIAIGNSDDPTLAEVAERLIDDESPLVRGMAVWALGRIAPARLGAFDHLRSAETDPDALAEWQAALTPVDGEERIRT